MPLPRLYDEFASWWPVLSDPADYEEEAGVYADAIVAAARGPVRTVLELGCGGGNNASWLKRRFALTLSDRAPGMLGVSRALNPECEHVQGDMRTLRLDRSFDAVFVHDAVSYMTSEQDLGAAMTTAFVHCRPGGVALFVPDFVAETWNARAHSGGHDRGDRSLRYLEWIHDPDPDDGWYQCNFAYLLREGSGPVRLEGDEHRLGLFPRATWLRLLEEAGFVPEMRPYRLTACEPPIDGEIFLGVRPG